MEQWRDKEHGGPHLLTELRGQRRIRQVRALYCHAIIEARDLRPDLTSDLKHHIYVANGGHILKNDLFLSQKRRGYHRQYRVLATARTDFALQRPPAMNHETTQIDLSPQPHAQIKKAGL